MELQRLLFIEILTKNKTKTKNKNKKKHFFMIV